MFEYDTATGDAAESETDAEPTTVFQSTVDGFRVQVPNGWVVDDIDSSDPAQQQFTRLYGEEFLVTLCPENQALPAIGGSYLCPVESPTYRSLDIVRFNDLNTRPELAVLARENKSITTSDLLALFIEYTRGALDPQFFHNFEIINNTDIAVNTTNPLTNQTTETVPAKYVELGYSYADLPDRFKWFILLVLSNDKNMGYVLQPLTAEGFEASREAPIYVRQVLDSFELLTPTASGPATTPRPLQGQPEQQQPSLSPFSQPVQSQQQEGGQPQQQQQLRPQNQDISVSIVSGSSSLTTGAYQPNPIQVSVGDTVIWTNNDSQPHTATSGENATPDQRFDSGILAPADTFEHTFTEPGEYPYFCLLHPNMVGTVSVS